MGKKYGSIHIKTDDGIRIAGEIFARYDGQPNECLQMAEYLERTDLRASFEFAKILRRYATIFQDELFIVITENWVSLYNRDMSFQTIAQKARSLAKKFPEPIIYTSNFDDDVFVFGLLVSGKTVTSGRICEAPEFYDLTTKAANMAALRRVLGETPDKPKGMPTDIFDLEELLSSMMGIPLFAYAEDLDNAPDQFEMLEEHNGICVYRKKNGA